MSRYLYIKSNQRFYRSGKQCRERFLNHLDDSKKKGKWSVKEDLRMLESVKNIGKKWSLISRKMGSTRTEHTVKNRYLSLIKKKK